MNYIDEIRQLAGVKQYPGQTKYKSQIDESDLHIRNTSLLMRFIENDLTEYVRSENDIDKLIAVLKFATGKKVLKTANGYTVMLPGSDDPNDDYMKDMDLK